VRRRAIVLLLLPALAAFACSSFSSSTDDVVAPDAGGDAGDDAPSSSAPDATVFFDGFEDGDCSRWTPFIANVSATNEGHASGRACMLCRTGDGGARPNASKPMTPPPDGGTYEVSFFAKPVDAGSVSVTASIELTFADSTSFHGNGSFQTTGADWTSVRTSFATDAGAASGNVVLLGNTDVAVGQCFLFDDVRLVVR
jgi:hypothetical protein